MVRSSLALGPMPRNITRYRRGVRVWTLVLLAACGKDAGTAKKPEAVRKDAAAAPVAVADAAAAPLPVAADSFADLGAALKSIIPPDARVVGFGELHNRTDRAQVKSSLAHFTQEG